MTNLILPVVNEQTIGDDEYQPLVIAGGYRHDSGSWVQCVAGCMSPITCSNPRGWAQVKVRAFRHLLVIEQFFRVEDGLRGENLTQYLFQFTDIINYAPDLSFVAVLDSVTPLVAINSPELLNLYNLAILHELTGEDFSIPAGYTTRDELVKLD
ncbi:hypothetical protein ABN584_27490 [Gloeocapsa sp. BRSZ]